MQTNYYISLNVHLAFYLCILFSSPGQVRSDVFGLGSRSCLNSRKVCDGEYDCPSRWDEANCREKAEGWAADLGRDGRGRYETDLSAGDECKAVRRLNVLPDAGWVDYCRNATAWGAVGCQGNPRFVFRCAGNEPSQCILAVEVIFGQGWGSYDEHCQDRSDVVFDTSDGDCRRGGKEEEEEEEDVLPCADGTQCVHESLFCDGIVQCRDGSDEPGGGASQCGRCPRSFGYPGGEKRASATLACRHRFTGRTICATPCDGVDDLCQGKVDEDCSTSAQVLALLCLVSAAFSAGVLAVPCLGRKAKGCVATVAAASAEAEADDLALRSPREATEDGLFKLLIQEIFKAEDVDRSRKVFVLCDRLLHRSLATSDLSGLRSLLHLLQDAPLRSSAPVCRHLYQDLVRRLGGDERLALAWLRDSFGTCSDLQGFLEKGRHEGGVRLRLFLLRVRRLARAVEHTAEIRIWAGAGVKVFFYYFDYFKDLWLILVLLNSPQEGWSSFGTQLVFLSVCSLVLSAAANVASLASNVSVGLTKGQKATMSILVLFLPAKAIVSKSLLSLEKLRLVRSCSRGGVRAEQMKGLEQLEAERVAWRKLVTELKRNENVFENSLQVGILLILSALSLSDTKTVHGQQTSIGVERNALFVAISMLASLKTLTFGTLAFLAMEKDGFLPSAGKAILGLYLFLSVSARSLAVVLYFTPVLGLFDTMHHHKLGSIPISRHFVEEAFDLTRFNETHFVVTTYGEAWRRITPEDLTVFSLRQFYVAFFVLLLLNCLANVAILAAFVPGFRLRKDLVKKFFHVLSLNTCPTMYRDWDGERGGGGARRRVALELGGKIVSSGLFNLLCLSPLLILNVSIRRRNEYLRWYGAPLPEEDRSTRAAAALCAAAAAAFAAAVPALQGALAAAYYRFGHPWARLWGGRDSGVAGGGNLCLEGLWKEEEGDWKTDHARERERETVSKLKVCDLRKQY